MSGSRTTLTYAELDGRANRLAWRLRELGVGAETLVGLHVERSPELIVGLLAILKAGGAYVPLDPLFPHERLARMREDTDLRAIVTDAAASARVAAWGAVPVRVGAVDEISARPPDSATGPESAAYVLYTSGSTGQPKGVVVTHRNVARLFAVTHDRLHYVPDDVWTCVHSCAFDFSVFEIWGALLHGGRLVVVEAPTTRDPKALLELLRRQRVTVLCQTPSAFRPLAAAAVASDAELALRLVVFGGEALEFAGLRRWVERYGDRRPRLVNMYGITETTVHVTCRPISAADVAVPSGSLIGAPLSDLTVHLLDARGLPVAPGEVGEIYVGGAGVARGYLRRPDLDAERFLPDPFSSAPGARLYRSGDLARRLPDGDLEFVGRVDDQVQIRGFRVEPGEVAAVMRQAPGVADAVVVADAGGDGGARLVAYLVAAGDEPSVADLRAFARRRLPDYMLPSAFVSLPSLPLTDQGKLDRAALPGPGRRRPEMARAYAAPRSPSEKALARLWAEILVLDRVGRDDDFFELGGHSLLATSMVSRARLDLGVELPLAEVFATPTLGTLAALADGRRASASPRVIADEPARNGDAPLTAAQERVWFLERLHPPARAYRSQATVGLRGPLDVAALAAALTAIVRRHESYRSTFPAIDGRPVQRVHEPGAVRLEPESVASAAALRSAIERELARPIDLERLPIVRWTLFATAPDEHVLLHAEHHLVHDGWSFNRFLGELAELYSAGVGGEPSCLPPPRLQLGELARRQRRWLEGDEASRQGAYWRHRLTDAAPEIALPFDRPRPARPSFRGATPRQCVSGDLADGLRKLSHAAGTTLFMTMLAAFATLLHRLSGQTDLAVGTGIANRRSPGAEDVLGMVLNNLVLRCDLSGNPTFRDLLRRVRSTALGAYANQDLPFDRVVEILEPRRDPSRNPLFQVAFSFHDAPLPELRFAGLDVEIDEVVSNGSAKFDLNVIAIPERERRAGTPLPGGDASVRLLWEYATDLFDPATIERMMERYAAVLAAVVTNPDQPVGDLDLAVAGEGAILAAWNDTARPYPRDEPVHRLFELQAERAPQAVAVVQGDRRISYRELDDRAARLARSLRRLGVGDESPVALLLERSIAAIVAILAVTKAGGAYLPLNERDPPERLALLLRDAGARVAIADEPLRGCLPEAGLTIVTLPAGDDASAGDARPLPRVAAESVACVLYTSGSTGEPKGVCVPHRAITRLVTGLGAVRLGPDETLLQMAPLAFDAAHFEIWGALATGARLALFHGRGGSPREIGEAIRRHGVTTLWLTAPLFHQVVDARPDALTGVRQLVVGGDVVSAERVRRALATHPGLRIIDGYGPTEATTFTCCHPMDHPGEVADPVPIGRPLHNTRVHVLDGARRPVGPGVVGELWIGGDGLARGYLGRPEETARCFVRDPFSDRAGDRLYRTGDLARWRPDGTLEFLGRVDRQVKVRGHRVEPGEVERALHAHPSVGAAAVRAWPDAVAGHRLVAYVVPAAGARISQRELEAFLAARIAPAAVPAAFVRLSALPLDSRGKVDHEALPAAGDPVSGRQPSTPPNTPTERAVAAVWQEVLGRDGIGIDDEFFDLGGHSLLAMQVASRLEERLGLRLPLRRLFEARTVAELAALIDRDAEVTEPSDAVIPRQPRPGRDLPGAR